MPTAEWFCPVCHTRGAVELTGLSTWEAICTEVLRGHSGEFPMRSLAHEVLLCPPRDTPAALLLNLPENETGLELSIVLDRYHIQDLPSRAAGRYPPSQLFIVRHIQ